MRIQSKFSAGLWLAAIASLAFPILTSGQAPQIASRITQAIDETKLTTLRGNTHPLARPELDRGTAPSELPMERMRLVLRRSADQETALETLLEQQQDASSPNFQKWLTPAQFGQQFGPSDQDIQTVTSWLQSHGFQINRVSRGRTVIELTSAQRLPSRRQATQFRRDPM
ncbi:MAG TPA: protease pro-enzyme activation domain-containing protein [Candidatus Acidoferrales bacterium]|nr:protease pro-enzyme activation domain-containing protein [Candidatus Acidoferrales bacterium]